jgi:hypothetical protein
MTVVVAFTNYIHSAQSLSSMRWESPNTASLSLTHTHTPARTLTAAAEAASEQPAAHMRILQLFAAVTVLTSLAAGVCVQVHAVCTAAPDSAACVRKTLCPFAHNQLRFPPTFLTPPTSYHSPFCCYYHEERQLSSSTVPCCLPTSPVPVCQRLVPTVKA